MNILYVTDIDIHGSGYGNIAVELSKRFTAFGHKVVMLGVEYKLEPHNWGFTVAPSDFKHLRSQVEAIKQAQWPDICVYSWDIPAQRQLVEWFAGKGTALYVGLFPVEAAPLSEMKTWVEDIRQMDIGFAISEFGLEECKKAGLDNVHFLPVGIDSDFWQPMDSETRQGLRQDLEIDDKFVVITVADNQFRKNLAAGIRIIAEAAKRVPNIYYVIVARPHSRQIGWSLNELAERYGVEDRVRVIHSRPTNDMLLRLYQASDLYLCTSFAEGLGLPILEAQGCGLPAMGGGWTAIKELIVGGNGVLIPAEYEYVDPFGNQNRYFMDIHAAAEGLIELAGDEKRRACIAERSREFACSRNYDRAAEMFLEEIDKAKAQL